MSPNSPARPSAGYLWVHLVGGIAGAIAGLLSLDVRRRQSGYWYGPRRHSGVGGAFQSFVDGVLAIGAGSVVGARLGYLLLSALVFWFARKRLLGGRPGVADIWVTLPALVLLLYLVYVCNFG